MSRQFETQIVELANERPNDDAKARNARALEAAMATSVVVASGVGFSSTLSGAIKGIASTVGAKSLVVSVAVVTVVAVPMVARVVHRNKERAVTAAVVPSKKETQVPVWPSSQVDAPLVEVPKTELKRAVTVVPKAGLARLIQKEFPRNDPPATPAEVTTKDVKVFNSSAEALAALEEALVPFRAQDYERALAKSSESLTQQRNQQFAEDFVILKVRSLVALGRKEEAAKTLRDCQQCSAETHKLLSLDLRNPP